jgi:hypothetical protein
MKGEHMTTQTIRNSQVRRTGIEDLPFAGSELSEQDLQMASGGRTALNVLVCASYQAASSTFNCDTDYNRVD